MDRLDTLGRRLGEAAVYGRCRHRRFRPFCRHPAKSRGVATRERTLPRVGAVRKLSPRRGWPLVVEMERTPSPSPPSRFPFPRTRPLLVGAESSNPSPSSEESGELDLVDQKRDKALPPENARHDGGFHVTVANTPPSSLQLALHGREYRPPHYLVPRWRWRWCRYCAGDRAKRAAGCCPDCSAGSAASRSADRRAGPRTDQAAADRSLAGVIGVCARRQTERQRQRNPARSNTKCFSHVLTRSARDCPDNTTRLGQVPPAASSTAIANPRNRTGTQGVCASVQRGARTATQCYRRSCSSCCALGGGRDGDAACYGRWSL